MLRDEEEGEMPDHFRRILLSMIVLAVSLALVATAGALTLITEDEARLPPGMTGMSRGGITLGPGIVVVTPSPEKTVKAPFAVKVNFQPHGGSKIDASRVKVIYLKNPAVDVTARMKASISGTGIDLADATAPPGTHDIKIDVTDDAGRTKSAVVSFTVVK
jgi:hypothetical protein